MLQNASSASMKRGSSGLCHNITRSPRAITQPILQDTHVGSTGRVIIITNTTPTLTATPTLFLVPVPNLIGSFSVTPVRAPTLNPNPIPTPTPTPTLN